MMLARLAAAGVLLATACSSTTDHLGDDPLPAVTQGDPPFADILDKTPEAIDAKVEAAFQQLFYGDPDSEAIYVESGSDGAFILNTYGDDRRSDGLGYGMFITVQLGKREEFDRLWTLGDQDLRYHSGPRRDFLYWNCGPEACPDPNGTTYAAAALLMAERRWSEPSYGEDARALLAAMLHKEAQNGGVVENVHSMVDAATGLIVRSPLIPEEVTTSFLLPAFYEYFAQRVPADAGAGRRAAAAARQFLLEIAHPETGLVPEHASLDGSPLADLFATESHRVGLNIALDHAWYGSSVALPVLDRSLTFFESQGEYVAHYTLGGAPQVPYNAAALVASNGAAAAVASGDHEAFVQAVWDMPIPTGEARSYDGLVYLMTLLYLSGHSSPL